MITLMMMMKMTIRTRCQRGLRIILDYGTNSDRYYVHQAECKQCQDWWSWINDEDNFTPIGEREEKALEEELKEWADSQLGPIKS